MKSRDSYAEPWRIKMVESIRPTTSQERMTRIKEAGFNLFNLASNDVYVDLLTDSGTTAMSDAQWAALMLGDEAYAGSRSFFQLKQAVQDVMGFPYVVPTHQGRAAENILMTMFVKPEMLVPGNMHFDTTEGHIRLRKAEPKNLLAEKGYEIGSCELFKGDIDLEKLEQQITSARDRIPFVMLTITCNNNGGQPVSMHNIRQTAEIARRHNLPLFLDAARFAENAYFIKQRDPAYASKSIPEIALEMFSYADGCTMSAKKDGMVNIGGFLAFREESLYRRAVEWQIVYEGFATYGGMAGRDLAALSVGLREVVDERYLEDRCGQVELLGDMLQEHGVPIITPVGGHGVYVDARQFYSHLAREHFPAQTLAVDLYVEGGVRGVELGGCAFGYVDPDTGLEVWPELELVRLAIPRRVYTDRHIAHVARTFAELAQKRRERTGLRLIYQAPVMRHFTARFERLER